MKYIFVGIICFLFGAILVAYILIKIIDQINQDRKKRNAYYSLFNQWLFNLRRGQKIGEYFQKNGYKRIAIYGMRELGTQMLEELSDSDVQVDYVIDRDLSTIPAGIIGYCPNDELPKVDVIVVTASFYFSEIKELLKDGDWDIVSIDDVICYKY